MSRTMCRCAILTESPKSVQLPYMQSASLTTENDDPMTGDNCFPRAAEMGQSGANASPRDVSLASQVARFRKSRLCFVVSIATGGLRS